MRCLRESEAALPPARTLAAALGSQIIDIRLIERAGRGDPHMEHVKLILVPLDCSPESLLGLSTASRLAWTARAAVVLSRFVVRSRCGFTTPV
jgi:hypothetical protein